MKKLKKLLNEFFEYEEKRWPDKLTRISNIDNSWEPTFELENWYYFNQWYIISKQFWFISWLVENDKIDRDNQALQYAKSDLSKFFTEWKDKNWMSDDYAMLLMLLSIQDNPIEFLISILK